jgi:predicted O-methyltransferase YrrM
LVAIDRSRLRGLKKSWLYRYIALPRRAFFAGRYVLADVPAWLRWLVTSREESNFTYDLTDANLAYLAHILAVVTGESDAVARAYIEEIRGDRELADHLLARMQGSAFRSVSDNRLGYARRLGWYALVRLTKPRVVVETGVDKGLGATVLCAALLRNRAEGHEGRYYGTDIDPAAGWLLTAPYAAAGEILYGDSIESLDALDASVDLFINDSDHSADYEAREYETILPKLSPRGIILGDNAHVTAKLAEFSSRTGRAFLFFKEDPKDHWYPGAGIGISYPPAGAGG